ACPVDRSRIAGTRRLLPHLERPAGSVARRGNVTGLAERDGKTGTRGLKLKPGAGLHPPEVFLRGPGHQRLPGKSVGSGLRKRVSHHRILVFRGQISDQLSVERSLHGTQSIAAAGREYPFFDFAKGRHGIEREAQMAAPAVFRGYVSEHWKAGCKGSVV